MFAMTRVAMAAAAPAAFRYWRIQVTANSGNNGYGMMNEVELRGSVGGADLTAPSTPVTALPSGSNLSNLVSGNISVGNYAIVNMGGVYPYSMTFDLLTPQVVRELALYPRQEGWTIAAPSAFSVQGSNDGTNFATIKALTASGWAAAWKTFTVQ